MKNPQRILLKIVIFSGIVLLLVSMVYRGLTNLDKKKADDKERSIRLENGTCVFDKLNLDRLLVKGNGRAFPLMMNIDTLLFYHKGELYDFVYDTSLENSHQSFVIDNVKFNFDQNKNRGLVTEIKLDHASPFQFVTEKGNVILDPSERLPLYIEQFPKSYECRTEMNSNITTLMTEIRIDNTVKGSALKFMLIHFSVADQVVGVDFAYE
jgi:hypothetical protein